MAVIPPGVTPVDFAAALRQFAAAVGDDWVISSDADLVAYRDHYSPVPLTADELLASAAVSPATVEQVQAIVRIANQYKTPLYPISTGKNFAYGGPAPNLRGSVVVDLKRMNRVLEVDADREFRDRRAGVSYFDLYRHIQESGLKGLARHAGSRLGLARRQHARPRHRLHTRSIPRSRRRAMRHGGRARERRSDAHWHGRVARTSRHGGEYKYGFGPDPSGLFAQGNFGIVTKMGLRLMPQPEHWRNGLISVPKAARSRAAHQDRQLPAPISS